jgi:EpsI family protein
MRGNIAIRISIAAAVILLTYWGMKLVAWGVQLPEAELPAWKLQDLPKQLGEWTGEDKKLDERLVEAEEAEASVEREYHNASRMPIAIHIAFFSDANKGIWHNPMSCYQTGGWLLGEENKVPIFDSQENSDKIKLCMWGKENEKVVVGHWYQLGDLRLYTRWDMGWSTRWQMRGRQSWPVLIKILISAPAGSKPDETKAQLVKFAGLVHQWINQPEHETADQSHGTKSTAAK